MPSRRRWIAAALVVLLLHGCSHDGDTLESATATPKPDPIAATVTMRPRPASPATTLHAYLAAITDGEAANAIELLAQDAAWVFNDLELNVGTALPPDLDWLTEALDLSDAATGRDAVQAILSYWVAMRAVPVASECDVDQATATCRYHETDAATEVSGASREGAITVEIVETQIVRLALRIEPASGIVSSASDAFARWAAIEDPTATLDVPTVPMANRVVTLIDTWEAMERPDVPRPDVGDEPIDVVEAWLGARNSGDWPTMVALMSAEALADPFGSRDEMEAARLLNRVIAPTVCSVQIESVSTGSFVACDVSVSDIIVNAAGTTSTNLNQATFRVKDGYMVAVPQYIPSSFVAESAIETWARANHRDEYAASCVDGIAGQSAIDGLTCARFIADYEDEWAPLVAALGLGS